MSSLILSNENRARFAASLRADDWLVVCLCADWCGTCKSYQASFAQLATQFPSLRFVWLDIEDQADLLGDVDIENFPSLLIQRGDDVLFFGTVLPEIKLTQRLLDAQLELDDEQIRRNSKALAPSLVGHGAHACNLRQMLRDAGLPLA